MLLDDYTQVMHFWQDYSISNAVSFSVHHIRKHTNVGVFHVGDVNVDLLVKVVSAKCFHYKVTIFLFAKIGRAHV